MKKIHSVVLCVAILLPAMGSARAQELSSAEREAESLFVAQKAFEDGFYEVSLGLLERFLKNYPDSQKVPEVKLLIGQCYFHLNRFLDALARFEELQALPAARSIKDAVIYWIAEVHFKGSNFSKAASYYKVIIDDFPASSYLVHAYYSLGWCFFQESKFGEALEYFKAVEEKFPKEPEAKDAAFKLIECLYNLKDYAALKEKLAGYLKAFEGDAARLPVLYFYSAEADYYLNNFADAIEGYSRTIARSGDEKMKSLSRLGLAWSYLKMKKIKEAQEAFSLVNADSLDRKNQDALLLGKAALAFEAGDYAESRQLYGRLIEQAADVGVLLQAYLGEAEAFYNSGDYASAVKAYRNASEKIPLGSMPQESVDKLHYGLAWSFLKEGEFKEAIEEFRKVAKSSGDKTVKVAALCQMGDAYQDSGDYRKAQEVYDSILKDYPDSLYGDYVQYQLGLVLLKTSNYEGAVMAFQRLKQNFPASKLLDDASYATGLAYFQAEDYAESKKVFEIFQQEYKESPLRPQAVYLLGTSLYNMGKFAEAIEVFKEIIRTYSFDAELVQKAEYEIADSYYQMGNEKEAVARFKALRAKYPDSRLTPEVMWWLGEYYYRSGDLNTARRYFSSLIQDFSKSALVPDAYYVLGSIAQEAGNYEEAMSNFRRVIEEGTSDLAGQAEIAIADIYSKQGRQEEALAAYGEVAREHANLSHLVYPKLADIYRKNNDYARALEFYRKSLELVPVRQMPQIQFIIAEVLQAQGKNDEAVEEYLKVTYLYPEKGELAARSLLRAAQIYEEKEAFKEAVAVYRKVVSMNIEESKYAKERIDWIEAHAKQQ